MTREKKKQILDDALTKAYEELEAAKRYELDTTEFNTLLRNIADLEWLHDRASGVYDAVPADPDIVPGVGQPETNEDPIVPDEVQPEHEKTSEPLENDENEKPKFKMEDVRGALAKARARGVNVSEIIRSFGAENFQQITADQYPAIMAKLAEG